MTGDDLTAALPWVVVAALGTCVGIGELVSRYRDNPPRAVATAAGRFYIAVNLVASLAALACIYAFGWTFGASGATVGWTQVLVAGFGSMALFRSSLFKVKVGEQDVAVGPAGFLQIILDAADRAVDRDEGRFRATDVCAIMQGIAFEPAALTLPTLCGALMQNLSNDSQRVLADQVKKLQGDASAQLPESAKVLVLGLALMDAVGPDVLKAAVDALGSAIRPPAPQVPVIQQKAAAPSAATPVK